MGVDLSTYRCRIGSFISWRSADVSRGANDGKDADVRQGADVGRGADVGQGWMKFFVSFCKLVKFIGTLTFIGMLLLMAGIESNPGPTDTFVFRYLYLLVETGTKVLRQIFDVQVGHDFMTYLANNSTAEKTLKSLMTGKNRKITTDQERLLPPLEKHPKSSMYDITLLTCLLRNVCGLKPAGNQIWTNPLATDQGIEADITRLKKCRNEMMHMDTLRISEGDLKTKWQELVLILNRLNRTAGIGDLATLISDAQQMDIDEELKERYLDTIKTRDKIQEDVGELKHGQSEIQEEVGELKHGQSEIQEDVGELKHGQSEIQEEVGELKHGQSEIQEEVGELKHGQSEIQEEVGELKHGRTETQENVAELKHGQSEIQEDVGELKHGQSEIQEDVGELKHGQSEIQKNVEELKHGQSEIQENVEELIHGQSEIQENVEELKHGQALQMQQNRKNCDMKGIQQKLVDIYCHHCSTLQVAPLFEDQDEDLLKIYQYPTMHSVPYHQEEKQQKDKKVTSYQDIFCKGGKPCRNVYITGDAGTGKTSFCKRLCLVWCMGKGGGKLETESRSFWSRFSTKLRKIPDVFSQKSQLQKDIEYMKKFDCLFYVSLRDTSHYNVIKMIEEQLLYDFKKDTLDIDSILTKNKCIVLMDALDEWSPDIVGPNAPKLPQRNHSEKCVHITTCRPYKVENVRLSRKDIDHHVRISGIQGDSSSAYVEKVINYMNRENSKYKNMDDFMTEIEACGLEDQLCIPMLSAHLVMLWFETGLTGMTRATIFANSLEMLFERAEKRGIAFPLSPSSEFQLPECLSQLKYCNKHLSLLYKVGLLSFKSLFKQDDNVSSLVFTSEQLQYEPFHLSEDEQDFLCKIGFLSKNKVIGCSFRQKLKLSFFHKSYLEFFGALFISVNNLLNGDMKWSSLNELIGFGNFLLLLAGLSGQTFKSVFHNIYSMISDDLSLCRRNAIFHYNSYSYRKQIKSLQNIVIKCFKEVRRYNDLNIELKLEDFIFDRNSSVDILKKLLSVNTINVKSIHSVKGKYYDEFDQIKNLQCLHVGAVFGDYVYDVKFTECMLQNQSTLHTVCIEGSILSRTLIPEFPVRSLQHLTSLSLSRVKMQHNSLHNLVTFLSDNVLIENIKLYQADCDNHHRYADRACTLTLNLPHHTKLTSLYLKYVNIVCNNVNNSSLKSITVEPLSESIVRCYIDVFNCIKYSQLEHLYICGSYRSMLDKNTIKALADSVKTLPYIKSLTLWYMKLPDDVLLQLHPDVTQVKIVLVCVTLSLQCFHCFIDSCVNNKSVIKVELSLRNITSVVGRFHRELSEKKSAHYMSKYLTSIPTVNITHTSDRQLDLETGSCQ